MRSRIGMHVLYVRHRTARPAQNLLECVEEQPPDSKSTADVLRALNDLGVQLAPDDFGTGDLSLSHLRRFPIDPLKIDASFMHDLASNADDASIVNAVIGRGKPACGSWPTG